MTITLQTNARNAACDAIVDLLDVSGPGVLEIANSTGFSPASNILATITLANPAFGSASTGTATLSGTPLQDVSADNTGTAFQWRMRTSGGTAILTGPTATSATGADITLDVTARNAALNAISALINSGSADSTGDLEITTSGDTGFSSILIRINLAASSFAAASSGSMAITGTPSGNATAAGTAGLFRLRNRDNTEVLRGVVGTEMTFNNAVFGVGSTITISTLNISLPATSGTSDGVLVFAGGLAFTAGETIEVSSGSFQVPAT